MSKRWTLAGLVSVAVAILAVGPLVHARGGAGAMSAAQQSAATVGADWSMYNTDLHNSRFSPLDEINTSNVGRLTLKWTTEVGEKESINQVTPLVVNGVMYFNAGSKLYAVNAATGQQVWTTQVEPAFTGTIRSPAYGDGRIYIYGRSIVAAVDAKTGAIVESFGYKGRLLVADAAIQFATLRHDATGYSVNTAPAYHNGTLYFGIALSENHIPGGLVIAADGRTGAVKWVFKTIPQGPQDDGWETTRDTWRGGTTMAGGGVWTTPAVDAELGLVYVNVGNPSADYDGSARKGINLFTNSIVALHMQTGKLAWYYQTVHHDIWDLDLVTGPILFDVNIGGRTVKAVASGGKNCLMYMWNRETGQPLHRMVEMAVPTATDVPGEEPWPTQPMPHTAKGVPMQPFCSTYPVITNPELVKQGRQIYFPYSIKELFIVSHGGSSYGSPSFSPKTGLLYITGKNAAVALKVKPVGNALRQSPSGVGHAGVIAEGPLRDVKVGVPNSETVTAYNPVTGDVVWQEEHPSRSGIGSAGNLATAGDLVFQGSDTGDFYGIDARSGKVLFRYTLKGTSSPNPGAGSGPGKDEMAGSGFRSGFRASPLTFHANGRQYVSVVASRTVMTFGLP